MITVDQLVEEGRLITVDEARERMSATEPLNERTFGVGTSVRFRVGDDWNLDTDRLHGTDLVDAHVSIGALGASEEYQLTKDSLLQATSVCGLPKPYTERAPGNLTTDALNHWFRGGLGDKSYKILTDHGGVGTSIVRPTIVPFSNLRILDEALGRIRAQYGVSERDVYVDDTKFHHSLRRTYARIVIPAHLRDMNTRHGTDEAPDQWMGGVEFTNSLVGEIQTEIAGYLYRMLCTNGMIDVAHNSGRWSRRQGGQDAGDVYAWARDSVDEILGGLEHSFDTVQDLTAHRLDGDTATVTRDVFDRFGVPVRARERVLENLVDEEPGNTTMYEVVNAITQAANADSPIQERDDLMRVGGRLSHHAARCGECRRILPN